MARIGLWKAATLVLAMALVMVTVLAQRAQAVPQPNLEAALGHLEQAKAALEKAEHNKGGFRVKALEMTNAAIAAVREGINVGNR